MSLRRVALISFCVAAAIWLGSVVAWADDPELTVPVRGISARRLRSSFGFPRDHGRRRHRGIDIFARRGTPVVAAAGGLVVGIGESRVGGKTVRVFGDGALFYYAHLDTWADGLELYQQVEQGDPLGTVGNTGNARGTRPHLHFEIRPLAFGFGAIDPATALGGRRASRAR